ncbi:O-antigen ligase family protein [Branchiibius cervicis]|uniref:O-antigen ligase family protein n=1 Tax=Branchiibius cervicis TaxID=908252 RepID=A0ABW2AQY9_9MICO
MKEATVQNHVEDDLGWLRSRRFLTLALFFTVSAWFFVPRFIQTLQAAKTRNMLGESNLVITPLTDLSQRALFYATILVCLWVIAFRWTASPASRGTALVLSLAPGAYMLIQGEYVGVGVDNAAFAVPLTIIALWVLRPRIQDLAILGYLVGVVCMVSVILGFVLPDHAILRSSYTNNAIVSDKEILPWGLLVGIFTDSNNFGQFIATGLPSVLLIRRRRTRWFVLAVSLFALVWTASRGSMEAVVVSAALTAVVARCHQKRKAAVATTGCILLFVFGAILPFLVHEPTAFTNRGVIWMQSIDAWQSAPLFGLGANWFTVIGSSTASLGPNVFHAHNQFLQLLVTGGIIYAVLVGMMLVAACVCAGRLAGHGSLSPTGFLAALAGVCVFEVSLVIVDNRLLFPVVVLPLATILFTRDLDTPLATTATAGTSPMPVRAQYRTSLEPKR